MRRLTNGVVANILVNTTPVLTNDKGYALATWDAKESRFVLIAYQSQYTIFTTHRKAAEARSEITKGYKMKYPKRQIDIEIIEVNVDYLHTDNYDAEGFPL